MILILAYLLFVIILVEFLEGNITYITICFSIYIFSTNL